jgi:signal transduction histidine kinase
MADFMNVKNLRITTKFVLWFLFISLIPLVIATYVSYRSSQNALQKETAISLRAVADNKANQIGVYLHEQEKSVSTLSHMSDAIVAFEKFDNAYETHGLNAAAYEEVENEFRPFLTYYQRSFDYDDLFMIHPNGTVLFSAQDKGEFQSLYELALFGGSELSKVFIKAQETLKTEISDFEYDADTQSPAVFIAAPVFKGVELLGVVAVQMDNKGVSEFMKDYQGLGKTGEIMAVAKMGNEVVFIAPLRFDPQAAFKRRVAIGSKEGHVIQKVAEGESGSGISVDYRGKKVMMVWRYLPSFRWGIVVKMDTSEVFSSADRLRNNLLKISLALLALVIVMAVLIARSVSGPIKDLTRVSGTIAGGDLSARAEVNAKDEIGELAQSLNQMTDKLVEAKANVEEQRQLLEKANKELDSFVYTASHDLRAPLRGISSFASFLEEDYRGKLDDQGKDYLKEIREGAGRMDQLIEDLLKLSRISRIKNPFEEVKIGEMIQSVTKRIGFDIKEKHVDLRIQQEMPTIQCDRIKLSEVFLNLINNAIKFSSKNNKENPRVEVGYIDDGEFHKFFVKDNGIGIEPQYHNQVFGIFKRLHTSSEYEGTGAGLSIVKRVIDDHNGRIWIESEAGKGATFFFTIPKVLQEKTGEKQNAQEGASGEAGDEKPKKEDGDAPEVPEFKNAP